MMKAGAGKFADIMIPKNDRITRIKKFIEIQTAVSQEANENLQYNLTMFEKEQDFLRYLRLASRSPMIKTIFSKMIEYIYTDELIYIPIIDGLNLTPK